MKHFLLIYDLAPDYLERRAALREQHLQLGWSCAARGEIVLGGALADPVDTAMILFRGESAEVAERFARADPYVLNGLVVRWQVRLWNTVIGEDAASPVRPTTDAA